MIFSGRGRKKRVGIFGGSFDPPHIGHSRIARWLFEMDIIDKLWVIPCFVHPLGKKCNPFDDRVLMCKLAFGKITHPISVRDVERELGGTSYTLRTIEHLQKEYPEYTFKLITGGDVQVERAEWHNFDKIEEIVEVVSMPRGAGSVIPDVSSTEIRDAVLHEKTFADMVEMEVGVYIVTRGLYLVG